MSRQPHNYDNRLPEELKYRIIDKGQQHEISAAEIDSQGGIAGYANAHPDATIEMHDDSGSEYSVPIMRAQEMSDEGWMFTMSAEQPTSQQVIAANVIPAAGRAQLDRSRDALKEDFDNRQQYRLQGGVDNKSVAGGMQYNPVTGHAQQTLIRPSGENVFSLPTANDYKDYSAGAQLREATKRLRELEAKRDNRAVEVDKEWIENNKDNKAPLSLLLARDTYAPKQITDNENRALALAINQTKDLIEKLEDQRDREQGIDVGFWRGFGRTAGDARTWDFGLGDLLDAITMLNADQLIGENATEGEKEAYNEMMRSIYDLQVAGQKYDQNTNFWNRAGVMAGYMPSFIVDFVLTGGGFKGINATSRAASKVATKALGKEAIKNMSEMGVKSYIKQFGAKGLGQEVANYTIKALGVTADDLLIRAPLMANTIQAGKTGSAIIENKLGDVTIDDNGSYQFSNDKSWGEAAWQTEADQVIENYSEMVGTYLDPVLSGANIGKLANVFGAKRLSGMLAKADAGALGRISRQTQRIFGQMGLSNYVGEVGEEYYGQLWRTLLGLDSAYQQNPDGTRTNLFATGQFHGDIWGGMALSMGMMDATRHGVNAARYAYEKHKVNIADKKAGEIVGNDVWESLRQRIDNTSNEEMGDMFVTMLRDEQLNQEQKEAILNYMEKSMNFRGYNLSSMADSRNTEKDPIRQEANESYTHGNDATDAADMQDIKNTYDLQLQQASQQLTPEIIAEIDGNPVNAISALRERGELSQPAIDYINARQAYNGMMQRIEDDINEAIEQNNAIVDKRTNRDTGLLQEATLKVQNDDGTDRRVHIIKGNIALRDDGTIDKDRSDRNIAILDVSTGEEEIVSPDAIFSVESPVDPAAEKAIAADAVRQSYTAQAEAKMNGIVYFQPGDTYNILTPEGQPAQIQIVPNAEGITDNGDGTVNVTSDGGQNVVQMSKDAIQEMVNAANIARVAGRVQPQQQQEQAIQQEEQQQGSVPDYYPGSSITFRDNDGNIVQGVVNAIVPEDNYVLVDIDTPSGLRVVPYKIDLINNNLESITDENGNILHLRIGLPFSSEGYLTETPLQEGPDLVPTSDNTSSSDDKDNTNLPQIQEESALSRIPIDENGQPIYEQTDPETAWDAIVEQTGGNEDIAVSVVNSMISDKESQLKKVEKSKPKGGTTIAEKIAAEQERNNAIQQAQAELKHWRNIANVPADRQRAAQAEARRLQDEQARENAARIEQERRAKEEAERIERETLNGVPDMIDDTPADARARGYRRVSGNRVDRQPQNIPSLQGKEVKIKFNDSNIPTGHVAIIDTSLLQPSHINGQRNPKHFIDEAQPKERKGDDSTIAASRIASNIRPEEITSSVTAYTGAPTVNTRGEVIQGNNRSTALREMWSNYPEQAAIYRQYLIDNAEEFGMNPQDIAAIQNPVLVNMLDIDDAKAIELGQYVASDTESGGIERIRPKNVIQRMGKDIQKFTSNLLNSTDEEATFAQLIDRNGGDVLKWMNNKGYITPTQYRSAFDSKGTLTDEVKNDLRGIIYQSIFEGTSPQFEEMFNMLPAKAQKAILSTAYRDYDSDNTKRLLNEIQNSVRAYYALSQYEPFVNARNYAEAQASIQAWSNQYLLDDVTGDSYLPAERFNNFNLLLAAMYKGQTQKLMQSTFNNIYDIVQGVKEDNLFETVDNTPRSLADAINETINNFNLAENFKYNGQLRSSILGSNTQTNQSRRQGSDRTPAPRKRTEVGDRTADSTRGTESGGGESIANNNVENSNLNTAFVNENANSNETNAAETGLDNGRTVEGRTKRSPLGESETWGRIARTAEAADAGGIDRTIRTAEKQVNTNPTEPQKEAGNYKKGHVKVGSFDITIEQPKGSIRSGVDANGNKWESEMQNTYGYIRGTKGVDGDHIDVFLADNIDGWNGTQVFVIDQYNEDGTFDEHKVMLGFNNQTDAFNAYLSNYEKGWENTRKLVITSSALDNFKEWIDSSNRKTKPYSEYKNVIDKERKKYLAELQDFHDRTASTGRTSIDEAKFEYDNLYLPLKIDGKVSPLAVMIVVPDRITDPSESMASYLFSPYPNSWDYWETMTDNFNAGKDEKSRAFMYGDTGLILFDTVDNAVEFYDFVNNSRQQNDIIQGLETYSRDEIKSLTRTYIENAMSEAGITAEIAGMEIHGSRNRGDARLDSDLDIVVEYKGDVREDDMFNALNDTDNPFTIEGIAIDINPIRAEESGTLEEYMARSREYDKEQTNTKRTDRQGNPIDENGKLIIEKIKSIDELTNEDFTNPQRNVQLPAIPKNVDEAIGAGGKPVIIKKNIFEKNTTAHQFTPEESRKILSSALYNPNIIGKTHARTRKNYWVAIKIDDKSPLTILEVNDSKDNIEVVGWYTINSRNLERIKRQAEREDGELLILTPEKGAAASLSTLPSNSSSAAKDSNKNPDIQKIEDYGEQIAGARKDILKDLAKNVENTTLQSLISLPFAKAFKRPDLKKAFNEGALREKDVRFAEAVMAATLSRRKPKAGTRKDRYSKWDTGKTQVELWAENAYSGIELLKSLFMSNEAERDALIERTTANKTYDEDKAKGRQRQLEEWNPGRTFNGTSYPINPVAVFSEVLERLGYEPGSNINIPITGIVPDSSYDRYDLIDSNGNKNYYETPKTFEEVVNSIVYLTKLDNADADTVHPRKFFSFAGREPVYNVTGWVVYEFNNPRSASYKDHTFQTKKDAQRFIEERNKNHSKGYLYLSEPREIREVSKYNKYEAVFINPLTGNRVDTGIEYNSKEEAENSFEKDHDRLDNAVNQKLSDEQSQKKGKTSGKDILEILYYKGENGWKYGVAIADPNARKYPGYYPVFFAEDLSTRKEAEELLKNNREKWETQAKEIREKRQKFVYFDGESQSRAGEDYRNGKNITAEEFANTFGFRGVQFGNWTNQNDRQAALNNAFDAFMDLSRVLNVSPRALSLNGELGIAFGSRGTGNANAHYEPGNIVINLTKTRGAGSLAHEWWHALDNYFARQGDIPRGFVTADKNVNMRSELRDAFNKIIDNVAKSDFHNRSRKVSSYFGNPIEETARLFGEWVVDEMAQKNSYNHFLSRGIGGAEERYAELNYAFHQMLNEAMGKKSLSFEEFKKTPQAIAGFVYPTRTELAELGKDVRNLFDTVQEKIDEETGNTILYHKSSDITVPSAEEIALRDAVIDKLRESGLEVITDVEVGQRVLDEANRQGERVRTQAALNGLKKASDFILSALSEKTKQRKVRIEIPERANRLAEEAIGHPIKSHAININELTHIKKRHGENGTANDTNSIPLRDKDIALMPYIMAAPTRVVKGNMAANGTESVRYEKDLENGVVVVVEREGRFDVEDMENITMWANKKPATNVTVATKTSHSTSETIVISEADAAKIRKDAETAIENDGKIRLNAKQKRALETASVSLNETSSTAISSADGAKIVKNLDELAQKYENDLKITDHVRFFKTPNGDSYGFTIGNKIYIDPRIASAETPIHEYTHLWASALRKNNPQEWQNIVGLMKDTPVWKEITDRYSELQSDDEIADEVLATYSGHRGAQRLRDEIKNAAQSKQPVTEKAEVVGAFARIREALRRFWKNVADLFNIRFTSAEEVADRVMNDLLEGINPARTIREQSINDQTKTNDDIRFSYTKVGNISMSENAKAAKKAGKTDVGLDPALARFIEKNGYGTFDDEYHHMGANYNRHYFVKLNDGVTLAQVRKAYKEYRQSEEKKKIDEILEMYPNAMPRQEVLEKGGRVFPMKNPTHREVGYAGGQYWFVPNIDSADEPLYRIRESNPPVRTGIGYKVFVLKNGKLYPPMVANPGGAETPVGVWLDADAAPIAGQSKTGRNQVKAGGKGTQGGSGKLAYRPGWHLGEIPYAIQFNRMDEYGNKELFPANFVWAEVEYANDVDYQDEAMSYGMNASGKFQHSLAGLPRVPQNGSYRYRTNPNPKTDPWIITGAMRVNRLLTPSEVDSMVEAVGREPQRRQYGAVTDEEINRLNADFRLADEKAKINPRTERRDMVKRVNELAKKLHLDNVEVVTSVSGLDGKKARAKGFYSKSSHKITIVIPNNRSVADAEMTLLHEAVAHYGLRQMFGKHFDTFLDNVFNNASEDVRQRIIDLSKKHGWDFRKATEEYLAGLSERMEYENAKNTSWWQKIKDLFLDMLHKIGFSDFGGITLTDNELRYILWRSYENLKGNSLGDVFNDAADTSMQYELKVGEYAADVQDDTMYRDNKQSTYEKSLARDRYEQRVSRGMYQTQEALQDSMLSVREAMDAVLRAEGKKMHIEDIAGFENAYLGENRLSSVNKAEADAFAHTLFKPLLDEVARLSHNEEERTQLMNYMMAKHGLERNKFMAERDAKESFEQERDKYPNITLDDLIYEYRNRDYAGLTALTESESTAVAETKAMAMVDEYEKNHDVTQLWQRIKAVNDAILSKLYETGMMSKATYDYVKGMYKYYIPLRGFDEKTSAEAYAYLTHKDSAFNAPIKKAIGRTSKADDPLAYMQSMAESAIMQGNRNKLVKQRFFNFVLNHPSDLASINDIWLQYDSVNDEWKPVFPDNINNNDTAEDVERKMQEFEEKMQALKDANPDMYKHGKETVNIPYKVVSNTDLHQHQIVVNRNGRDYIITINGNPRAAQAINGQTNPDNDLSGAIGTILKAAEKLNRQLSAFYTTRNPDFVVSNFIRDMLYANSMAWIRESPNYALRFHRNFLRANPAQMKVLFAKLRNNTLDMNDYLENMFYQFIMNGGETGYANIRDIENRKNDIRRELRRANGKLKIGKAVNLLGERLDEYNRAVENCARFAAFMTSREMGRTIDRSIYDAKEASVNFNKKGSGSKFYNSEGQTGVGNIASFISGLGRSSYVFWNAAIQGTTNFGRQAKRHPAKAFTGLAAAFILGALIAELGGDDDDDKNAYYNLPEYVRRSNIMFRAGDSWISIPLPVEYRAVYGLGELMTSTLKGKENLTSGEMANQIASQVSQILPLDLMNDGGLMGLVPSAVKPFAEVMANESWTGLPIYKDTPWNKDMPDWTKAYKSANKEMVGFAEMLNDISGGDEYTKGKIDINPAAIQHILEGYFGGVATTIDRLAQTAEIIAGQREYDPRSILLLNRVVKNGDERTEYRAINNEYFRLKDEHDRLRARVRNYEHDTKEGIFDYAEKLDFLYNSPEYARYEIFEKYRPDIDSLYDELKETVDENDRKEIETLLNEVKRRLVEEANATRK